LSKDLPLSSNYKCQVSTRISNTDSLLSETAVCFSAVTWVVHNLAKAIDIVFQFLPALKGNNNCEDTTKIYQVNNSTSQYGAIPFVVALKEFLENLFPQSLSISTNYKYSILIF
jgi:hypothetical protein